MSERLRCAIIGCGVIAPTHAESLLRDPDVELAWACDVIEDRAKQLAGRFGAVRVSTDYRELLADETLDCVTVCTDHASHAAITVAALDAGKHVLCEKALAATRDGLDAMFDAHARRPGRVFGGVFQHRFDAVTQRVRRLVQDGALGTMLNASLELRCCRKAEYYLADAWRGTWAFEGGAVLINQAIHFIDVLAWIMGGAQSISAVYDKRTHGPELEAEDTAAAALRFSCGALGTINATSSSHQDWRTLLRFCGSVGTIAIRDGAAVEVDLADAPAAGALAAELAACKDHPGVKAGKDYYGTGHAALVRDFLDAVRNGHPPQVSAVEARHAVEIVLAAYESHRTGTWRTIRS